MTSLNLMCAPPGISEADSSGLRQDTGVSAHVRDCRTGMEPSWLNVR
jgi:hypothetical protein